jgi:hypothetical protein
MHSFLIYNFVGEWEGLSCWIERVKAQKYLLQGWERSKDEILSLKNSILEGQKVRSNIYIPPYICMYDCTIDICVYTYRFIYSSMRIVSISLYFPGWGRPLSSLHLNTYISPPPPLRIYLTGLYLTLIP